mgnify:CR=1 FL=1
MPFLGYKLMEKYDELEQYQRCQSVRIFVMKEEQHENTDDLVMDIASKIGVKLVLEDMIGVIVYVRSHHRQVCELQKKK